MTDFILGTIAGAVLYAVVYNQIHSQLFEKFEARVKEVEQKIISALHGNN